MKESVRCAVRRQRRCADRLKETHSPQQLQIPNNFEFWFKILGLHSWNTKLTNYATRLKRKCFARSVQTTFFCGCAQLHNSIPVILLTRKDILFKFLPHKLKLEFLVSTGIFNYYSRESTVALRNIN